MPAIRLTSTGWLPLSALSGAPTGTAMYLQNQGSAPLLSQESATQPAATDNGGVATQPGQSLTVTNGSAQIWLRSSPGGVNAFAGGIPSGTTITAPLTATSAQLYTTVLASANNGKYAIVDGTNLALSNGTNWVNVANGVVLDPIRSTPVTGVTLNQTAFTGQAGGTVQLTATVAPAGASTAVTWFTSDPNIATVSQSGLVLFVGAGTVYISVRTADGNAQAYAVGTLTAVTATSVTISPGSATLVAGGTQQLTATVAPTGATQAVSWSSNNPALARVSQSGVVTLSPGAVGGATVVISATTANGVRGSTTVTVASDAIKLKAVTRWNSVLKDVDTLPGTSNQLGYALRLPETIGGGSVTELDPLFTNWIMKDSRDGLCTNTGNALTITGASIEYAGVTKPLTFNGGSRSVVLADGEAGVFPDPLQASAFGIPAFPNGAQVIINLRVTIPTGGKLPYSSRQTGTTAGSQSLYYNPANTTVSSVDTPGAITFTGTTPESRIVMYAPLMIGRHSNANAVSVLVEGDSIGAGLTDNQQDSIGYGWANRLIASAGVAGLNLAVGGSRAIDGLLDSRFTGLYKYCTHGIINYGTNNPESAAVVVDLIAQRIAKRQAAGIARTLVAKRLPNTTSTDGWATLANQTADANVTASIAALNAAIDTAGFYGVLNMNSVRAPLEPNKWVIRTTDDGLHPGGSNNVVNGHLYMANEATPQFNAMITASTDWNGLPVSNALSELGHSFIANGQYSTDGYRSYGVATGAADDSAGVVRRLGTAGAFGNGGDSTLQIGVRTDAAIAAARGGVVYVWNGTNDLDAGLTNDQIIAEMKIWKQKAFAAQTVMIVHTVAPRGNDAFPAARLTTDQITQIKALNARMLSELPGVGFYVVDMNAQLLKPSTSFDIIDAYAPVDGKHPGNLWVQEVSGPADAAVLKSIYPAGMRDRPTGTTAASINSNVELTGASTTAGATLPTGYTSTKATGTTGTTITYQEVTTATGRWCQVVLGGTVATANAAVDIIRQISLQAKLVTGKTYEGVIEYEYDAGAAGVLSVQLGMQEAGSSTLINWDNNRYATQPMSAKARAGEMRTPPFTAIDGITDHRFRLSAYLGTDVAPAATFRFRMMENREVTGV